MKLCPICRRDYYDDSLRFCLDDGGVLLEGPATADQITIPFEYFGGNSAPTLRLARHAPFDLLDPYKTSEPPPVNAIAVLPFVNIGAEEGIEYFSQGLAEELLTVLSKIKGLRVAARTSAFSFADKSLTVKEIGKALNVRSVVEGSIRMAGARLRISVQLVDVEAGYHLWSETYDRTMDDIFEVQDDIARSVVEELRALLLGEQNTPMIVRQIESEVAEAVKGRADHPEAQRLMMLGKFFLDRTTQADTEKAEGYFREALALDPEYALCWAELGRLYSVQAGKAWAPVEEAFAKAREATDKALSLEPDLAEAHATSGRISAVYEWDMAKALAAYERALSLAPGSSVVLDGASVLFFKLGDLDRALELSREVLRRDPLSGPIWHNLGLIAHRAGLLTEADKAMERALELSPQRSLTSAMRSLVLLDLGRSEEAFATVDREPDEFWRTWAHTILFYRAGRDNDSGESLKKLIEMHTAGDTFQVAEVFAAREEIDKAFEWLNLAIASRDSGITHLLVGANFRALHTDPRWPELLERAGFGSGS